MTDRMDTPETGAQRLRHPMPDRPPRPCSSPGCPALVATGRCPTHQRALFAQQDAQRGTSTERGYGVAWRRLRAQVLAEEPLCRACASEGFVTAAEEVDHAKPKALGGTDARENLQALCARHNASKGDTERLWPRVGRIPPPGGAA